MTAIRCLLSKFVEIPEWREHLPRQLCGVLLSSVVDVMSGALTTTGGHTRTNPYRTAALMQERDLFPCLPQAIQLLSTLATQMFILSDEEDVDVRFVCRPHIYVSLVHYILTPESPMLE